MIKLANSASPLSEVTLTERAIDKKLREAINCLIFAGCTAFLIQAETMANDAIKSCKEIGDNNRQATANMVLGRILYTQKKYEEALKAHKDARTIWNNGCSDKTLDKRSFENNFIYMLKSMIAFGIRPESCVNVVKECTRTNRPIVQLRAKLIGSGNFGNSIDTLFQCLFQCLTALVLSH